MQLPQFVSINSPNFIQMDSLKSSTQLEIMNLTSNIEQFHQQWLRDGAVQHILQNNENTDGIERCIAMIRNKRTEWNALMDLKNKLKYVTCSYVRRQSEYYHFALHSNKLEKVGEKPVELSIVSEIENDLLQQEHVWYLYETFNEGKRHRIKRENENSRGCSLPNKVDGF